ncbi:MAG TPA: hypothetical protein PLR20_05730 [Syntrophales bacterium]|nr:hypothetical protein [Syntrophales bacterium]HOX94501.1 hypothetical protein [Syntrophales bacterium]HPI57872.1 hypothetical protein [Syntrophales bacterium]HPN24530.1 hypothetical protein [Syntrophales bacterium]HQM28836.1 hypothetical protein [Syntrophales bacterium]
MRKYFTLLFIFAVLTPTNLFAADFYLYLDNCKATVGYLVESKENIKTVDFDEMIISCSRVSQTIKCETVFFEGQKAIQEKKFEYFVELDSPPILIFTDTIRSDYFVVDLNQHAVTMVSRVLGEKFAGSKICTGLYFTESERKLLEEKKPRTPTPTRKK